MAAQLWCCSGHFGLGLTRGLFHLFHGWQSTPGTNGYLLRCHGRRDPLLCGWSTKLPGVQGAAPDVLSVAGWHVNCSKLPPSSLHAIAELMTSSLSHQAWVWSPPAMHHRPRYDQCPDSGSGTSIDFCVCTLLWLPLSRCLSAILLSTTSSSPLLACFSLALCCMALVAAALLSSMMVLTSSSSPRPPSLCLQLSDLR